MLDAVAPYEDESATAVDRQGVDQRQARSAASRKARRSPSAVAADQPDHRADDDKDEDQRQMNWATTAPLSPKNGSSISRILRFSRRRTSLGEHGGLCLRPAISNRVKYRELPDSVE